MKVLHLTGRITEAGTLEVDLPRTLPPGEAQVTIQLPDDEQPSPEEGWTDETLKALLQLEPLTGRQIVEAGLTGGWEHEGITDGQSWVEEQRRKRAELRSW